jgi:hypothetical protein
MAIDLHQIGTLVEKRLPSQARWLIRGTPLDFQFSMERFGLRAISSEELRGGLVPSEWRGCRVFGKYDYGDGGGASAWLAIPDDDGTVHGLDPERRD